VLVRMSSIHLEAAGDVAVLRMAHGKANTLDTELCREVAERLDEVERDGYRAAVLTGTGGIFSAGVDLRRVRDGGRKYIAEFLPALSDAFLAVFGFTRPIIAAVNGHAIAGGAVLAAACDQRVLNTAHGRIGVTELLVGVPFPLAALEILRCAFGNRRLTELTFLSRTYAGEQALALGLADELSEPEDRVENIRRVSEVAKLMADSGVVVITAFISPYRMDRRRAREIALEGNAEFVEVFIDAPLEVCEARDPKDLYKKARAGEIRGFTGIDAPYEAPEDPEIAVHTNQQTVDECVATILEYLLPRLKED